jgi:hypothetical protein
LHPKALLLLKNVLVAEVIFVVFCRADQPPNAPAPMTITEVRSEPASAGEPIMQAVPARAEAFKKLRRDLFWVGSMKRFENRQHLSIAI